MQKNETKPPSYTTHKNTFKWIKNLHIRPQTTKILEENIGSKILDIAHRNFLSDKVPKSGETKEEVYKFDFIKLKSFCTVKEIINEI